MAKLRTLLRLILFLAIVSAPSYVLKRWLRMSSFHPGEDVLFLLRCAVDIPLTLFATWLMGRLESRTVAEYGLPSRRMFRSEFWRGALTGFASVSALVGAMALAGVFHVEGVALHGAAIVKWAAAYLFVFVLVGVREEFSSRGYLLSNLSELLGFWPAAIATSILFGIAHLGNRNETWTGVANAALFGLVMCAILRRTGNLWMPIGLHAAFDWGETYFYGVADSGAISPGHLLNTRSSGSAWLSGGVVGPEGSVFCSLLFVTLLVLFARRMRRPNAAQRSPLPQSDPITLAASGSIANGDRGSAN